MTQRRQLLPDEARLRMADLCSRAEHCRADIEQRLIEHGIAAADRESILDFLCRNSFIDDRRFAESFARDKSRLNGWGKRKISFELARRKVDSATIRLALEDISNEEYFSKACKAACAKARSLDLSLYSDRLKLARFLYSRGYEPETAEAVIRQLRKEEGHDS